MKSSEMKILFIAPSLSSLWGGTTTAISNLALGLVQEKVQITIASLDDGDSDITASRLAEQGVESVLFKVNCKSWMWSPGLGRYLKDSLKEFDICHIHGLWLYPQFIAARYARRYCVPYIITPHGMLEPWALKHKWFKKKYYWIIIEKRNVDKAAGIHTITKNEQQQVTNLTQNPVVFMLPNGIWIDEEISNKDFSKYQLGHFQFDKRKTVLFLSRLHLKKGLDMLIPAFARLVKKYPDWRLILAGPDEGGYQKKVERLIKLHGISANILFAGMVQGDEKKKFYSAADIFVLPSYSEVMSIVALEAMSYSLPLLITSSCNFLEVERYGAGIVVEPNTNAIRTGLASLMEMDENKLMAMGAKGYALVRERYLWPHIAQQMVSVYESVVNDNNCVPYSILPRH